MTEQEKLIRAREACAAGVGISLAEEYRSGRADAWPNVKAALRALDDLDKPMPDPDEAWRPFMEAVVIIRLPRPFSENDRATITRIKAARHLMPKED